jgi:hypothetical protein
MPELLTIDEVATVLRLENKDKVYELMKRGLPYIEGVARGRLVLDEHLWKWIRSRAKEDDQSAGE